MPYSSEANTTMPAINSRKNSNVHKARQEINTHFLFLSLSPISPTNSTALLILSKSNTKTKLATKIDILIYLIQVFTATPIFKIPGPHWVLLGLGGRKQWPTRCPPLLSSSLLYPPVLPLLPGGKLTLSLFRLEKKIKINNTRQKSENCIIFSTYFVVLFKMIVYVVCELGPCWCQSLPRCSMWGRPHLDPSPCGSHAPHPTPVCSVSQL